MWLNGVEPQLDASLPPLGSEAFSLNWAYYLDSVLIRDELFLSEFLACSCKDTQACSVTRMNMAYTQWGPTPQSLMSKEIGN